MRWATTVVFETNTGSDAAAAAGFPGPAGLLIIFSLIGLIISYYYSIPQIINSIACCVIINIITKVGFMDKQEIAQVFREIALLIELSDPNPKKAITYRKAANTLDTLGNLDTVIKENKLEELPGVGKTLSKMIVSLAENKKLAYYENLKKAVPYTLLELAHIPGLGSKRIRDLYEQLNVTSLEDLETAIEEGSITEIRGFGPAFINKLEQRILDYKKEGCALLYPQAQLLAEAIKANLLNKGLAEKIEISGGLRRCAEIITDINFVALSQDPVSCLEAFKTHYFVQSILNESQNYTKVLLKQGVVASLLIVPERKFPFALFFETGFAEHVEEMVKLSASKGVELEDYPFESEEHIYEVLDIDYIPPEMRENKGEIQKALEKKIPYLIEQTDIKGALHTHTTFSDGKNTLEEMVSGAQTLGWEYIGISDHSKSSVIANGMSEDLLLEQVEKIHTMNRDFKNFKVFAGVECDILSNGSLDFVDDVLSLLDFVIVSVHSLFRIEEAQMTKRIIKAIENPYTTIVGHLTGRLLRYREPYSVNIPKIIDACIANDKIIELNGYPNRLDMDWRYWIKAKEKGLKCCINPDAHSISELKNVKYGVNMARKGWLEKKDVINTLPLKQMNQLFFKRAKSNRVA